MKSLSRPASGELASVILLSIVRFERPTMAQKKPDRISFEITNFRLISIKDEKDMGLGMSTGYWTKLLIDFKQQGGDQIFNQEDVKK